MPTLRATPPSNLGLTTHRAGHRVRLIITCTWKAEPQAPEKGAGLRRGPGEDPGYPATFPGPLSQHCCY